jgi:hypothetical protein
MAAQGRGDGRPGIAALWAILARFGGSSESRPGGETGRANQLIGLCFFDVAGVCLTRCSHSRRNEAELSPAKCLLGLSGLVAVAHQPRKALVSSGRAGQRATAAGNGRTPASGGKRGRNNGSPPDPGDGAIGGHTELRWAELGVISLFPPATGRGPPCSARVEGTSAIGGWTAWRSAPVAS